jgi:hypothetical protein
MDFPLIVVIDIAERERRRNMHTKGYKEKLERLRSARLNHHDQTVTLLDMQRLQAIKTHKPTTINFNHFKASFSQVKGD